jgi:hypothetical protein
MWSEERYRCFPKCLWQGWYTLHECHVGYWALCNVNLIETCIVVGPSFIIRVLCLVGHGLGIWRWGTDRPSTVRRLPVFTTPLQIREVLGSCCDPETDCAECRILRFSSVPISNYWICMKIKIVQYSASSVSSLVFCHFRPLLSILPLMSPP